MKMPRLLRIRQSLASRITLWVVLYVVVTLIISAVLGNYFILRIVRDIEENGILYVIGVRRMRLVMTLLFLLTLGILTYLLRRSIHKLIAPLTTFTQAVDEVARGNLQAELPVIQSKDEMRRLHRSFSLMQQSLARQMEELKQVNEEKGRLEGELNAARDIQLSMLPEAYTPATDSRWDISGSLTPAHEVGGDLYDFFVRDGKLFFCIGDVSGKGVPAALVMATTLCEFRIAASHVDDIEKVITYINRIMCKGNDSMMFVTFFAGVLDLTSGRLNYVNAGHNKPFIVSDRVIELPAKPGLPLGIEDTIPYVMREYDIPPGSMLFLYTDGLTEAMNVQQEQFGLQRLTEQLNTGTNSKAQIEKMTQAVHQFVGDAPQSDDLTMLAIRYIEN